MRTQYREYVGADQNNSETQKEGLRNIISLKGLAERGDVEYLQAVINEHCPEVLGLKALVIASGCGVTSMALAEMGFQVAAFDMNRNSIAVVQKLALQQDLNISFGMGGLLQIEKITDKFSLIHDGDCLSKTLAAQDRVRFLAGIRKALAEGGTLVLKTPVLTESYDPEESFESVRLDENYILWRQTPACDVPGVVEWNGKHWTAQKRVAPLEVIRQEVLAAGFEILSEDLEDSLGNNPATLRLVLTGALGR